VRVHTDGYTDTLTDANRLYNLSHAVSYIAIGQIKKKLESTKHPESANLRPNGPCHVEMAENGFDIPILSIPITFHSHSIMFPF